MGIDASQVQAATVPSRSFMVSSRLLFLIVLVNLLRLTALAVGPGGFCVGCCEAHASVQCEEVGRPVLTSRLCTVFSSFEILRPWASGSPALGQSVACRGHSRKSL